MDLSAEKHHNFFPKYWVFKLTFILIYSWTQYVSKLSYVVPKHDIGMTFIPRALADKELKRYNELCISITLITSITNTCGNSSDFSLPSSLNS